VRPEILLDELFVEGGRVQQAGAWHREEGLLGAGGAAGFPEIGQTLEFPPRRGLWITTRQSGNFNI